jgi:hypothetical protein
MTKQTKKPSRATDDKSRKAPKAAASKAITTIDSPELLKHVDAIRAIGKQTALNMSEIGRDLIECKRLVGHGGWTAWLKREFSWSQDTAERFMRLAADPVEFRKLRNLNLPVSSIYLLTAPSTPPEVREKIIDRASKGEKVEHDTVVAAVKAAKKPAKTAKPAKQAKPEIEITVEDDLEPNEYEQFFLLRAADCVVAAVYSGPINKDVIEAAKRVASTWQNLVNKFDPTATDPANEIQRLKKVVLALEDEIEAKDAEIAKLNGKLPAATDDGLDVPEYLRRGAVS